MKYRFVNEIIKWVYAYVFQVESSSKKYEKRYKRAVYFGVSVYFPEAKDLIIKLTK